MGLIINTTNTKLGMETRSSRLNIDSHIATLKLHQNHAKVRLDTEKPRVFIDQYQCFAEAGLKNNGDFTREVAQRGYRQAMKYIGQTASDGYALAAIENGGNPIAAIAVRDTSPRREFVLDFIPKSRPKIEVTGSIDIRLDGSGEDAFSTVEGNYIAGYTRMDFTPAKVNIHIKQYPSIDIKYEPGVDVSV